jgi:hypothetical protein
MPGFADETDSQNRAVSQSVPPYLESGGAILRANSCHTAMACGNIACSWLAAFDAHRRAAQ